jgi:hypothetical protein
VLDTDVPLDTDGPGNDATSTDAPGTEVLLDADVHRALRGSTRGTLPGSVHLACRAGNRQYRPYRLWSDYTGIVRRHLAMVTACLLIGLCGAGAGLMFLPKQYTAAAEVLVTPTGVSDSNPARGRAPGGVNLDTEVSVVTSAEVLSSAAKELGITPAETLGALRINVPPNTSVLRMSFTASTAEGARLGALKIAQNYLNNRRKGAETVLRNQIVHRQEELADFQTDLQAQTRALTALPTDSPQRVFLRSQVELVRRQVDASASKLDQLTNLTVTPGSLLDPPVVPNKPSAPIPSLLLSSGTALGLLLGLLVVSLLDSTQRRLARVGDLPRIFGMRVLAELGPAPEDLTDLGGWPLRHSVAEIATALPPDGQLLTVTSANGDTSGDETAAHLAAILARSGYSVILIFAENRSLPVIDWLTGTGRPPGQSWFTGTGTATIGRPGLTEVLGDGADPDALAQPCDWLAGLRVLGPGHGQLDVGQHFFDPKGSAALRRLRASADYLVVSCGPVVGHSQAGALCQLADATILTATQKNTSLDDISATLRRLETAPVLGAVYFDKRPAQPIEDLHQPMKVSVNLQ